LFAGAVLLMIILVHGASPARAATKSEAFIQSTMAQAYAIVNDKSLDDEERNRELRTLIRSVADIRRIALFTLGRYTRGAPEGDVHTFVKVFEDYLLVLARDALIKHRDHAVRVRGSTERVPGDVLVNAEALPFLGAGGSMNLGFRVRNGGGDKDAIVDLELEGVSLAIMGRMVFYFFMVANRESLAQLSDELARRTARLKTGDSNAALSAQ
jgi:ABC-type transporter MlaC component